MVECLDTVHGVALVIGNRWLGVDLVPALGDGRVVNLENQPGINDGFVFVVHGLSASPHKFFVSLVELIGDACCACRADGCHEAGGLTGGVERSAEVGDIGSDRVVAGIRDRADAARPGVATTTAAPGGCTRRRITVGCREPLTITAIGEAGELHIARAGAHCWHVEQLRAVGVKATEPVERVAPPSAVVHLLTHGLAELAIAGNRDAGRLLTVDHVDDRLAKDSLERRLIVGLADKPRPVRRDQFVGSRKAARVTRKDLVAAHSVPHMRPHRPEAIISDCSRFCVDYGRRDA